MRSGRPATPAWIAKSTWDVPAASRTCASKSSGVRVGGLSVGITITVVTPPAAAAMVPVLNPSFHA